MHFIRKHTITILQQNKIIKENTLRHSLITINNNTKQKNIIIVLFETLIILKPTMASLAFNNDKITSSASAFMELPNEEEKKMLVQLRDALKQDMERSKSCKEFPEIVSDYKLIRYIRGYEGVDGAVVAYRKMLRARETYPEIYDYRKNLVGEDIENAIGTMDLLKYCKTDQERKEMEAVINIGKDINGMTSDGIPYSYRCFADTEFQNAHEVLGKKPQEYFHKIIKKLHLDGILMELRLDALSKKNNKIARMIWIGDSTGYSFSKFRSNIKGGPWKIFVEHYFPKDENNKDPFETYAPESVGIFLLVNTVSNKLLFSYCFSIIKIYMQ